MSNFGKISRKELNQKVNEELDKIDLLSETVTAHSADDEKHVQAGEREKWNAKETPSGALKQIEEASYSISKADKDSDGTFTKVTYYRQDGTIAKDAILSSLTNGLYTVRTITYYEGDGEVVSKVEIYDLFYDSDGDFIREELR